MNTMMNRPVVVGIDGSDSALRAVHWAADEARRRKAALRLVHAVELLVGYTSNFVDWNTLHTAMKDRGRLWLDKARDEAWRVAPELHVDTVLEMASPVPTMVKQSHDAALVVIGSRGLGGFSGLMVGSTAVELAGRTHAPMVVIRGKHAVEPAPRGPIVVGVDGTPVSEPAIAFAFAQASQHGADLVAVHAWSDLIVEAGYVGGAAALDFGPLEEQAAEILAERLAGWQEKYLDVRVVREVVRDRAASALLRHGEQARLLVVGSRGRGGFRGLLLGSTSQHLLHHAVCPVAVIRTAQEG